MTRMHDRTTLVADLDAHLRLQEALLRLAAAQNHLQHAIDGHVPALEAITACRMLLQAAEDHLTSRSA